MRAVIKLELIGDNYQQHRKLIECGDVPTPHIREYVRVLRYGHKKLRPWVARLTGLDEQFGFKREFVHSARDYRDARGIGMRGIYEYFALSGGLYEVNECIKLGAARRYFILVNGEQITEIDCAEMYQRITPRDPANSGWD